MNNTEQNKQISQPQNWANPTPAGLVALAVACFVLFAVLTGQVTREAMPLAGCFLLGGFVVQVLVGLIDLKSGNGTGGNTFVFFAAYFMLASGLEMFFKYFMPSVDTRIDGWAWLALMLCVWLWTPAFAKAPLLLFAIVIVLDIALPFIVFNDFKVFSAETSKVVSAIAGWLLLVCGVIGVYLGAAITVNSAYGKTVLPNPKPLIK